MSDSSDVPVITDPPVLESLRAHYALYETLKSIMQMLHEIARYLREQETKQIVP